MGGGGANPRGGGGGCEIPGGRPCVEGGGASGGTRGLTPGYSEPKA